jgi:acyl dehydratase
MMATTYEKLLSLHAVNVPHRYDERDTLLYAISIGMGRDPLNSDELAYVFEGGQLRTVPTQAIVVARQRLIWDAGLDERKFLHGEQRLTIHRPLPSAASLLADAHVAEVYDKGAGKGAIIQMEGTVRDAADGLPLFSWVSLVFARGNGGMGGSREKTPPPHVIPTRKADLIYTAETRPEQALLYRLTGDRNPVHSDPELARSVGFRAPILHGACTYAIACREILAHVAEYDHTRFKSFDVRFTAPIYPGEHVTTEIWVDGPIISFRCRAPERDVTVLDHGRCELSGAA